MKHYIIDGTIYHKRIYPKKHQFTYGFFMLNINTAYLQALKNRFFSINTFNLFSFYSKDHFGKDTNFEKNIDALLKKFSLQHPQEIRFLSLPRMFGFVFNPISVLVLINNNEITHLLAEVHNYNGGRVVYKVNVNKISQNHYKGVSNKEMYVSPFFKREGQYHFDLEYQQDFVRLNVTLYEEDKKMLVSIFQGKLLQYTQKNILKMFYKHTFLTFAVVLKTMYQCIWLKLKGLSWNSVTPVDQTRRY